METKAEIKRKYGMEYLGKNMGRDVYFQRATAENSPLFEIKDGIPIPIKVESMESKLQIYEIK